MAPDDQILVQNRHREELCLWPQRSTGECKLSEGRRNGRCRLSFGAGSLRGVEIVHGQNWLFWRQNTP